MRLFLLPLLLACFLFSASASAQDRPSSFNLSTSKTFAPGEQPKIHLYTRDVDALEFRVYRVHDPVRFMENLRELHSFGPEAGLLPKEQIDERTWLEKFHDWKNDLWQSIRQFFRHQFSHEARRQLRTRQSAITRHTRIINETEFAQVPLLNRAQLVARWRQLVPPTYISDNNTLAVPRLSSGLYLLEATDGRYKAYTLVIVSEMALVTRTTANGITAFAVDRVTGQPQAGVHVDEGFGQTVLKTANTDSNGIAQLPVPSNSSVSDNFWIVASRGNEVTISTPETWVLNVSQTGKYVGYAFTERPVYRPGHTVHWKAILRERSGNALTVPASGKILVTISDENDKAVFQRQLPISAAGDITGELQLLKNASLGYYTLRIGDTPQDAITGDFHVEDYRKPEYRVMVTAGQKRVLEGASMPVTIDSRYFFGEPVANARVKYRVYHERHYWWGDSDDNQQPAQDEGSYDASYNGDEEAEHTGTLNANGTLTIQVPTQVDAKGHADFDYTVEAGVTDAANREITGRGRFLATYGTFRVSIEPISYAVHSGDNARFRVTTVDYGDKPVSTRVHVQLVFQHWSNGHTDTIDGPAVDVMTDAAGQGTGELPVGKAPYSSAELHATAAAVQLGTRDPIAETYLWIMGAGETAWNESGGTQIITDKKSYVPGDTAHLSIVSDISDFYVLFVVEGNGTLKQQVMHTTGKSISFDLPITPEFQPNVTLSAIFLKDNQLYQATKNLKVPPVQQKLQVQITPSNNVLQPEQPVSYDVFTRDGSGKPVSADISFGVVDEAIYSLYPDSSGDMIARLYPQRNVLAQVDSSLDYFFSGEAGSKSPLLALRNVRFRPQLAQVKPGNEAKPKVRKAFPDTAYWAPVVHTDSSGHAKVSFTFPDSLTTWRTTVHAITASSQAGSAINRVLVRKNILVRMGTPRFMLQGDDLTLPVIVHNYLDNPAQARISLDVKGLDTVAGSAQTAAVPSKGEATALWRLHASNIGTADLTASALTPAESDALELTFPVEPRGVPEALTHSGVLTQSSPQASAAINFPTNTDPASHSLHVEVNSSIAGSILPALNYLTSYPYGCTEQTMSSFLPNIIAAETLKHLQLPGQLTQQDLLAKMQAGLARLKDYQHDDGGWGWWKEDDSRVYMTAYVVSGIGQGSQYVPLTGDQRVMLLNGVNYLRRQLNDHPRMRPELRAAVVYALAEAGQTDLTVALNAQWSRRNDLQPEALAMTGLAMLRVHDNRVRDIASLLASKAVRSGELVHWTGSYAPLLDIDYNNDAEATAYAVRLLAKLDPQNPLLPPAARWLMLQRNGGFWWDSTEQTAMVLFGLVDYLAASHELDASPTAEIILNGHSLGKHSFTPDDAQSGSSWVVDIPAAQLQPGSNTLQVTSLQGRGRLYWSLRGRYFSTQKSDYQKGKLSLNLTRDYFTLQPVQKNGRIVYSLQPFHGTAQIGDILAVHEAINGSPMQYLLLEDPIPAGAEFVTNDASYEIDHRPGGWYNWFTRREFHDDHAAFFATNFSGRQEVFYLIRIVNPGSFQISPASVQPMYQQGVQATSDALHLEVPQPPATGGAH